ncbi:MAG: sugar phosphate isomerase/epimerase family protein [Granulosicoccus sp.]
MQYARPFTDEHLPLFDKIRKTGFDFIELLVPEVGELDLVRTRRALENSGLNVVLAARVNLQRNIASDDAAARDQGVQYLKYAIEVAAELDAPIVGGPLTGNPLVFAGRAPLPVSDAERQVRKDRCVSALSDVAMHAKAHDIVLGLEPLNRFESDVLCTTQQAMEVLDAVDHPSLKIMLDTFHMAMEEASIADAIRLAGNRIGHFQANENHRGFLGTGAIDWVAVSRALREVHYEGPISLEPFRRDDDRFGVPIAQWRPPHEDETKRLSASISFLSSHLLLADHRR